MKYYIIAGEASGDLYGSNLMKELKKIDNKYDFRFWGGDLMKKEGGTLVRHFKDLAFMGFLEILKNFIKIFKNIHFCKKDLLLYNPDVVIFIDYSGFNLKIAEFSKKNNIPTHYYISPKIWAWNSSRIIKIKKNVDAMYVILPFEKEWYKKYNYHVDFVGHPLLNIKKQFKSFNIKKFKTTYKLNKKPIIALLPGSRIQEIENNLPIMVSIINNFLEFQFVIAMAPSIPLDKYKKFLNKQVKIVNNKTYELLTISNFAIVTSGTATLETALFDVPQIVCYKQNQLSYFIIKLLLNNIKFISLVNLILNEQVIKELIQNEFTNYNLNKELNLLIQVNNIKRIKKKYQKLNKLLGECNASLQVAQKITKSMIK